MCELFIASKIVCHGWLGTTLSVNLCKWQQPVLLCHSLIYSCQCYSQERLLRGLSQDLQSFKSYMSPTWKMCHVVMLAAAVQFILQRVKLCGLWHILSMTLNICDTVERQVTFQYLFQNTVWVDCGMSFAQLVSWQLGKTHLSWCFNLCHWFNAFTTVIYGKSMSLV